MLNCENLLDVPVQVRQVRKRLNGQPHLNSMITESFTKSSCDQNETTVRQFLQTLLFQLMILRCIEFDIGCRWNLRETKSEEHTDGVQPSNGFTPLEDLLRRSRHLRMYSRTPPGYSWSKDRISVRNRRIARNERKMKCTPSGVSKEFSTFS